MKFFTVVLVGVALAIGGVYLISPTFNLSGTNEVTNQPDENLDQPEITVTGKVPDSIKQSVELNEYMLGDKSYVRSYGTIITVIKPAKSYQIRLDNGREMTVTLTSKTVVAKASYEIAAAANSVKINYQLLGPKDLNALSPGTKVTIVTIKTNSKTPAVTEFTLTD